MRRLFLFIFLLCAGCSVHVAGGPGGQTTNGIIVGVVYQAGAAADNAQVTLHRKSFTSSDEIRVDSLNRVDGMRVFCKSDGSFELNGIMPGSYMMECLWSDSLGRIDTFTLSDDIGNMNRGEIALQNTGTMKGKMDSLFMEMYDSVAVHLVGIERIVEISEEGVFEIPGLAPWEYRVVVEGYLNGTLVENEKKIVVKSGEVQDLGTVGKVIDPVQYEIVRSFLDSCGLTEVPVSDVVALEWQKIKKLNLKKRNIKRVHKSVGELTFLTGLYLDSNSISVIPKEIGALTSLLTLSLTGNNLNTLPIELSNCVALTSLYLADNAIEDLNNVVYRMKKLRILNFANNRISELPSSITSLSFLSSMDCSNNLIASVPEAMIDSYVNLLMLNFNNNRIDTSVMSQELLNWISDRHGGESWIETQEVQ